ncbi:MAG: hypothetical protein V4631_04135 [Pseudomonadota bacterium]
MARNGLVDHAYLMQWLENLARGQMVARMGLGLNGAVQAAAKDKHKNWLLVYGGGSVAALAMDVDAARQWRQARATGRDDGAVCGVWRGRQTLWA